VSIDTIAAEPETPRASEDEIVAAYLSYRRKDAFDLLELEESAGLIPIVKAYLDVADRFLPSRFDDGSVREKAQEVFLAAARAYAELADPTRRDALVKRREKLREEAAAEALGSFELAAECDAQNGTYAAEVAWCRYRLGVTPAANAIKLLKNAIRIDPTSGPAHLYAGQVQAALGKRLEAEAYVQRAATLMKGDPRPAEALRTLGKA
jgi:tetratricopeptide (TPR) repeat protein